MAAGPLESGEPVPNKYAGVIGSLDDLFLEPLKGVTTFAVQQRPARGVNSVQHWTFDRCTHMLMLKMPIMQ